MADAGSGADEFRAGKNARLRGRHGAGRVWPWLLLVLLGVARSAALAQAPAPPPPQRAELIEVRIESTGRDGKEVGRGWAVALKTRSGTGCQVLTPWHVVSDRTGVSNTLDETRVYGVGENIVGVKTVRIERVHPTLDLARVTLDSTRGCPFQPANKGRLPEQGLVVWWLTDQGGAERSDGDERRGVLDDDETGATAKAYLREAGIMAGMSGATVFINGRRAGMLIDTPGQTHRFGFLTARGIQRALGNDLDLFDLGAADVKPSAVAEPAFPFIDARTAPADAVAPLLTDGAQLRDSALFKDCAECPEMVVIPEGSFMMGSPDGEPGQDTDEVPQHRVTLKRFALAQTEVTVAEFRRFVDADGYRTDAEKKSTGNAEGCFVYLGDVDFGMTAGTSWRDPGFPQQDDHPVVCISWNDAQAYVDWLSKQTGVAYRLPSEAEFEYALRAGGDSAWPWGGDVSAACAHGNVADRKAEEKLILKSVMDCDDDAVFTAPVRRYRANGYGVYDLTGNAWEWVQDCWNANYRSARHDGRAWMVGDCGRAVLRGGAWGDFGLDLRSANRLRFMRDNRLNVFGFRPTRSITP